MSLTLLAAACVIPMVLGGLSGSPPQAALFAGVVMGLASYVVAPVLGVQPGHLAPQDIFATALIQALAIVPAMMALGLIGYGLRCRLGRMWVIEDDSP